jgi:uncharacterized membrane protein
MVSTRMMISKTDTLFRCLRAWIAAFWVTLCLLIIGAPILAQQTHYAPSAAVYLLFSNFCHQIPERSFYITEFPFAVCHRRFGIYLGMALGSLIPVFIHSPAARRTWIAVASVPITVDVLLPSTGLGHSVPIGRLLTGLLFGTMLATFLAQGVLELVGMRTKQPITCKGEA